MSEFEPHIEDGFLYLDSKGNCIPDYLVKTMKTDIINIKLATQSMRFAILDLGSDIPEGCFRYMIVYWEEKNFKKLLEYIHDYPALLKKQTKLLNDEEAFVWLTIIRESGYYYGMGRGELVDFVEKNTYFYQEKENGPDLSLVYGPICVSNISRIIELIDYIKGDEYEKEGLLTFIKKGFGEDYEKTDELIAHVREDVKEEAKEDLDKWGGFLSTLEEMLKRTEAFGADDIGPDYDKIVSGLKKCIEIAQNEIKAAAKKDFDSQLNFGVYYELVDKFKSEDYYKAEIRKLLADPHFNELQDYYGFCKKSAEEAEQIKKSVRKKLIDRGGEWLSAKKADGIGNECIPIFTKILEYKVLDFDDAANRYIAVFSKGSVAISQKLNDINRNKADNFQISQRKWEDAVCYIYDTKTVEEALEKQAKDRYAANKSKGAKGEATVDYTLRWLDEKYTVIDKRSKDVADNECIILQDPDRKYESQEYDHLVVSTKGIFNIETKSMSGTLVIDKYGNWKKVKDGVEEGIKNPLEQVRRHEKVLKCFIPAECEIISILCLANERTIVEGIENSPINIVKSDMLVEFIENYRSDHEITEDMKNKCISDIYANMLKTKE